MFTVVPRDQLHISNARRANETVTTATVHAASAW